MGMVDIEVGLTDEERAVRDTAHRFAAEVLRPVGQQLDKLASPEDVIAEGSPLWDVFRRYRELGLHTLEAEVPTEPEEMARAAKLRYLVWEEFGWGDAGLAISLGVYNFHRMFAQLSGRKELIDRFCAPDNTEIGCWAVTEPDHGSDTLAFTEPFFADGKLKPNCVARRDGDDFVISGQKSAWVSNGTIADVAALFCTLEPEGGFARGGIALVPLDSPGVSRGKPLDKIGQRALNQGEIYFDDVRIPADYMVVGADEYRFAVEQVLAWANAGMGSIFVGVARAALEHAIAYAKERVQGGVPIAEHQSVKARLFRMFRMTEAARSLSRRVALYNAVNPPLVHYSIASKVFSTATAFEVASDAVQTFGGNGLSREYPVEKLLRDARASMIEDGCNDILSLVGAAKLLDLA
ncbi:MAG: acyl-CoA dehydrogenase [Candidatus Dadabacteria bacterium]|nr:MAG: acyl-CoA dehydrogenase [Candidatus Dadabacteria bacterium]